MANHTSGTLTEVGQESAIIKTDRLDFAVEVISGTPTWAICVKHPDGRWYERIRGINDKVEMIEFAAKRDVKFVILSAGISNFSAKYSLYGK